MPEKKSPEAKTPSDLARSLEQFLTTPATIFSPKRSMLRKQLSTKAFYISMLTILFIGTGLAFGLRFYLDTYSAGNTTFNSNQPVTSSPKSLGLEVNNPDDNLLTFDKTLEIDGKTGSKSMIIISLPKADYSTQAGSDGNFSQKVNLSQGLNKITITAFDDSGTSKQLSKIIYYSPSQL